MDRSAVLRLIPARAKSTVVTLGPLTENVIDSNVGGYFAPFLKFSGFDALEIQGKAAEDVVIVIDGDTGRVTIETAPLEDVDSHLLGNLLTDMYSDGDDKSKRGIAVLSAGQAAEHIRYRADQFHLVRCAPQGDPSQAGRAWRRGARLPR